MRPLNPIGDALRRLESDDSRTRELARDELLGLGAAALDPLLNALASSDPFNQRISFKRHIVAILGQSGERRALPRLLDLCGHPTLHAAAQEAAAKVATSSDIGALISEIHDTRLMSTLLRLARVLEQVLRRHAGQARTDDLRRAARLQGREFERSMFMEYEPHGLVSFKPVRELARKELARRGSCRDLDLH